MKSMKQINTPSDTAALATPEMTRRKFLRDTVFTAAGISAFGILSSKAQSPAGGKKLAATLRRLRSGLELATTAAAPSKRRRR